LITDCSQFASSGIVEVALALLELIDLPSPSL
jgi:hypothetical protein